MPALESLARSEVNLSTLSMLADVLTTDTLELLDQPRFKTKAQVLELLARYATKPDVPDSVRQLPSARPRARAARAKQPAVVLLALSNDGKIADENFANRSGTRSRHALGGLPSVRNLRLMCRSHNALLAERSYGRAFMLARIAQKRTTGDPKVRPLASVRAGA